MSDASDTGDPDDIEAIKERKKEELAAKLDEDGDAEATPSEPVHVESDAHLNELVADHDVVLVDFYADWCGPCKMLEPVVESIAADTAASVAKVDVDALQGLAREYGVQGVPTLFLFVDGEPVERLVGMQDESRLRSLVGEHV
ncbi:MAG: thioredoxin [Haloarculaceae archaeon]